jgi:hypothetical protein
LETPGWFNTCTDATSPRSEKKGVNISPTGSTKVRRQSTEVEKRV